MKSTLKPGLTHQFEYKITENKTVPFLYPEAEEFQQMPQVLATGFMIGLFEWTCIQAINPHIDWPREQSVGIGVQLSHLAATPPGMTVTVDVKLLKVEGRKLLFSVAGHDGIDKISQGTHERFIIDAGRFHAKVAEKAK